MKISNEVANVLGNSTFNEEKTHLFLPDTQLERTLYLSVNKVLSALGGKWNRSAKAHLFTKPVDDIIEEVILTGEYVDQKVEYQFFETPTALAETLVEMAEIQKGDAVLEPSAGKGRIALYINKIVANCDCIELNEENRTFLIGNGFNVVGEDFLTSDKEYDVIVANPPFTKQQDIDHVTHMIKLAKRKVVAIMSSSIMFRDNKKTTDFRELVESFGGTIEALPTESFKESGTNVNTCVVNITK